MKKIILLLFSVLLFSCSNENIIEEYNNQEKVTIETSTIDSKFNGDTNNDNHFERNSTKFWISEQGKDRMDNSEFGLRLGGQDNCLDFNNACINSSIVVTNPFTTNLDDLGGYYYGSCFCPISSNPNDYFGTLLRVQLVNEFARHTNNINILMDENPDNENYTLVDGCHNEIDVNVTFGVPNDGDGIYTPAETNYMYREIICRILEEYDTAESEYIDIYLSTVEYCLCGNYDRQLRLYYRIYREN